MNIHEIRMQIKAVEERQRWARIPESTQLAEEKQRLQNRLNNAINAQERQRVYGTRNALIAEAATALQEKELSEQERKRLDFQVGQREVARASYMAANNGSDSGFDTAWGEIQQQIAKAAAVKAAAAYDTKSVVVAAVLAKYRR